MNAETLCKAMPGLSRAKAQEYLPLLENAFREFDITTLPRIQMALAQFGHESASLRYLEEIADGSAYEGRRDLGNTQRGDGRRFKGRGPIQVTGRANYTRAGQVLKLPLVASPQIAAQPKHAFRVSSFWWKDNGLNPISDRRDVLAATRRINGGTNGLIDRQARYRRVQSLGRAVLLGAPPPRVLRQGMSGKDVAEVQIYLLRAGLLQKGNPAKKIPPAIDGDFGAKTTAAVKKFQQQAKLRVDGIAGPATIKALRDRYRKK